MYPHLVFFYMCLVLVWPPTLQWFLCTEYKLTEFSGYMAEGALCIFWDSTEPSKHRQRNRNKGYSYNSVISSIQANMIIKHQSAYKSMLFNITEWNVEPMKTYKTVQAGVMMNVIYLCFAQGWATLIVTRASSFSLPRGHITNQFSYMFHYSSIFLKFV